MLVSQHRAAGVAIPQELIANARLVDIVAPMWLDATDEGAIVPAKGCSGPYTEYLKFCQAHNIWLMPIVRNFAPQALLCDPAALKRCAQEIVTVVQQEGFDGIVVDIEQMQPDLQPSLGNLMRELYPLMQRQGRKVCIAVNARSWGRWDYHGLAQASDWLYVMFYDYTGPWNKKLVGPAAPIQWPEHTADIERDLQRILATGTPPEKLLFGIPVYGNDFKLNPASGASAITTPYLDDLLKLQKEHLAERKWDDVKKCPYFEYADADNVAHEVWYEDAESFSNKFELALSSRLAGIAVWALRGTASNVNSDFWATVEKRMRAD